MSKAAVRQRCQPEEIKAFFAWSEGLDHLVLRPLSHIHSNWELSWDHEAGKYEYEENSFAGRLNLLVDELALKQPPVRYHDNEDRLAEFVAARLNWGIRKEGNRWIGADYAAILEQGGIQDMDQQELTLAAIGRVYEALKRGQTHIDHMEKSHAKMLGAVLSIILYHRSDDLPLPVKRGAGEEVC